MSDENVGQEQEYSDIEQTAMRMGWAPEEKYKGDPDRWINAETFVKRAENELPIARSTIKRLDRRLEDQERLINEMRQTFQEFKGYHEQTAKREYEKAINDLKTQQRMAVRDGDEDKYNQIEAEIIGLSKAPPISPDTFADDDTKTQETRNQNIREWQKNNPWFTEDYDMGAYANYIDTYIAKIKPGITHKEHLEEITKAVMKKFPDKFGNGRKSGSGAAAVHGGDGEAAPNKGNSGKNTYASLPADAKSACDKFVKQGLMTREQYVKDYYGE